MPPKSGKAAKAQDKAKAQQKAKVAEDKTFGLKNKNKSAKVQTYVAQVQKSAQDTGHKKAPVEDRKAKQKLEEQRQRELNELFAQAVKQPKLPVGVDPKSVLCEYFKVGQCTKGFKCKYSHDLNIGRKTQKIDLFTDKREGEDEEGMEEWDQEKLESVVKQKHGAEKPSNQTEIICKYFLEAVEKKQYGWFWQCPNGGKDCKYRHALPPGYVLKSQMKELLAQEMADKKDIEDEIEEDRRKVDAHTPITLEVFLKWRQDQAAKRAKQTESAEADRRRKGHLTGREIFAEEGFLAEDDQAAGDDDYEREREGDDDFKNARDLGDFARQIAERQRSQAASSSNGAGPSGSHEAGPSSSDAAGPSHANGTHLSEADAHLFLDDDDSDEESEDDSEVDSSREEEHTDQDDERGPANGRS